VQRVPGAISSRAWHRRAFREMERREANGIRVRHGGSFGFSRQKTHYFAIFATAPEEPPVSLSEMPTAGRMDLNRSLPWLYRPRRFRGDTFNTPG
jgi:hypothetical protein